MTTQRAFPEPDRRAGLIAQRVRGLMGELRISQSALARELGMTQQAFSRRTTGTVEFGVGELEHLADVFGVGEAYLYGFTNDRGPRPELGEGLEVVRHQGLEPRTRWLTALRRPLCMPEPVLAPVVRLIPGYPADDDQVEHQRPPSSPQPEHDIPALGAVVLPFRKVS